MSSSLSQRLKAVQEEIVVEHKAPREFSLDELKQMTVTWGQKGKGSTFYSHVGYRPKMGQLAG